MSAKITKQEVSNLADELVELQEWITPKPNPEVWPPVGWTQHPTAPGMLYRCISEEDLREEIFGSERKSEWMREATNRISEIKEILTKLFFPKAKEEGTQRIEKHGFAVMLKTGLDRKIDLASIALVVGECQKMADKQKLGINIENEVIDWKPSLKVKEFRNLPEKIQKQLEEALEITPTKPQFDIVKLPE